MTIKDVIKLTNELSEPFIVNLIESATKEHKLINTIRTRESLISACMTMIIKDAIKLKGVNKLLEEVEQVGSLHSLFNNKS